MSDVDDLIKFLRARQENAREHVRSLRLLAAASIGNHRLFLRKVADRAGRQADAVDRVIREYENAARLDDPRAETYASVLFTLAAVDQDHEDHREEWKP